MDEVFKIIYPIVLVSFTEAPTCPRLHLCSAGLIKRKPGGSGYGGKGVRVFSYVFFLGIFLSLFERARKPEGKLTDLATFE